MINAGPRLAEDVAPPEEERGEQNDEAGDQHPRRTDVHEPDTAGRERQRGNGAERRPRARIDHVIGVGLGYCWARHSSLPPLRLVSRSVSRPRPSPSTWRSSPETVVCPSRKNVFDKGMVVAFREVLFAV